MALLPDPLAVTRLVVRKLDKLQIPYFIGGSLASSAFGIPRSTQDVDIVAKIGEGQVRDLVGSFKGAFYIDEDSVRIAVRTGRSFNMIHFKTSYKVDVFIAKADRFSSREMQRRVLKPLGRDAKSKAYFASPEDIVIAKLLWFIEGGKVSDRQWKDIAGVLKTRSGDLDLKYLHATSQELGIHDLLEKALNDSAAGS